jgi:hypothetical protein
MATRMKILAGFDREPTGSIRSERPALVASTGAPSVFYIDRAAAARPALEVPRRTVWPFSHRVHRPSVVHYAGHTCKMTGTPTTTMRASRGNPMRQ